MIMWPIIRCMRSSMVIMWFFIVIMWSSIEILWSFRVILTDTFVSNYIVSPSFLSSCTMLSFMFISHVAMECAIQNSCCFLLHKVFVCSVLKFFVYRQVGTRLCSSALCFVHFTTFLVKECNQNKSNHLASIELQLMPVDTLKSPYIWLLYWFHKWMF